jgi:hypothetical protein
MLAAACGGSSHSPSAPSNQGGGGGQSSSGGSTSHGTMSATIDGAPWVAGDVTATLSKNHGSLIVSAVDAKSTESLAFAAASPTPETNPLAPGRTLQIPGTTSNAQLGLYQNGFLQQTFVAEPGRGGSGSITIDALTDSSASGTFSFVMKLQSGTTTKTVTNGIFSVTF